MKGSLKTLDGIKKEVTRLERVKQDYLTGTEELSYLDDNSITMGKALYTPNNHAHGQIAARYRIPKAYYDRMGEIEGLRRYTMNEWFKQDEKPHFIRTYAEPGGNTMRAFLSDTFNPVFDNILAVQAILPVLTEQQAVKNLSIMASGISERRLYIQVLFPKLEGEIKVGQPVQYGITISNSEVGVGTYNVEEFIGELRCMNGYVAQSLLRRRHVGKRLGGESGEDFAAYRKDTIEAEIQAYRLRLRDLITAALEPAHFEAHLNRFREAAGVPISKGKFETVLKNVTRTYSFNETEEQAVMDNFIQGGELNKLGVAQAVTATAKQVVENLDRQYDLERIGNQIIDLDRSAWRTLHNN